MAEAALRLDERARASQLKQSRVAARRSNPRGRRGRVLEFPGGRSLNSGVESSPVRPQGSTNISDEALYNLPATQQEAANNQLAFQQKELENKRRWQKNKMQARATHQNVIQLPREVEELPPEARRHEEMQEAEEEFRRETSAALTQDRSTQSAQRERLQTVKRIQEARQKVQETAKKIKDLIKKAKQAKDAAWTAYEVGSVAESEGAAVETVNTSGVIISIFRSVKTVIMGPSAQVSDDPDAGQLLKGVLSFIEPTALRAKDITAWVAGLHAIYGYLLLIVIFIVITEIMIWFGLFWMGLAELGNVTGLGT